MYQILQIASDFCWMMLDCSLRFSRFTFLSLNWSKDGTVDLKEIFIFYSSISLLLNVLDLFRSEFKESSFFSSDSSDFVSHFFCSTFQTIVLLGFRQRNNFVLRKSCCLFLSFLHLQTIPKGMNPTVHLLVLPQTPLWFSDSSLYIHTVYVAI